MVRYAVLVSCLLCCLGLGCGPEAEITQVGSPSNRLHLIPFRCSYLGITITELADCSLACPGRVFEDYDLATFTAALECRHPAYEHLQCRAVTGR